MPAGEDHLPAPGSAFAVSRRGYDPGQVDDYLRHLDAQLRMLAADRDAAVEQNAQLARQVNVAWAETDKLKGQLRRLSSTPENVEGMSERLQTMLRLAQEEVTERRRRAELDAAEFIAKAEAAAIEPARRNEEERLRLERERTELELERNRVLSEANSEAERARAEAHAEAHRVRSEAATETTRLRTEVTAEVERRRSTSKAEREELDAKGTASRSQIEEDFEIAMAARRAELMTTMERNRLGSQAEAKSRLDDADSRSKRQVQEATALARKLVTDSENTARSNIEAATRRVHELDTLRDRLRRQLHDLRGILDHAIPALAAPEPPRSPTVSAQAEVLGSSGSMPLSSGESFTALPEGAEDAHDDTITVDATPIVDGTPSENAAPVRGANPVQGATEPVDSTESVNSASAGDTAPPVNATPAGHDASVRRVPSPTKRDVPPARSTPAPTRPDGGQVGNEPTERTPARATNWPADDSGTAKVTDVPAGKTAADTQVGDPAPTDSVITGDIPASGDGPAAETSTTSSDTTTSSDSPDTGSSPAKPSPKPRPSPLRRRPTPAGHRN